MFHLLLSKIGKKNCNNVNKNNKNQSHVHKILRKRYEDLKKENDVEKNDIQKIIWLNILRWMGFLMMPLYNECTDRPKLTEQKNQKNRLSI